MNQTKNLFVELYVSSKKQFQKFANEYAIEHDINSVHYHALSKFTPDEMDKLRELKGKPILLECTGLSTTVFSDNNKAYKVMDVKVMSLEEEPLDIFLKFPIKTYELQSADHEWLNGDLQSKGHDDKIIDAQFYWELVGFKFVGRVQED